MAKHRKNVITRTKPLVQSAGKHAGQFVTGKHKADSSDNFPAVREFSIADLLEPIAVGNPFSRGRSL
jgi:hypothetical protein